MEIPINTVKARNKIFLSSTFSIVIWFILLYGCLYLFFEMFYTTKEISNFEISMLSIIISIIISFILYGYLIIKLKSLVYNIEGDRLISKWEVITKHIDSAKLQVVNSVDIVQDIFDRIFDLYQLKVCYGFSAEGYYYTVKYMDENNAKKLMEMIKPSAKLRIDVQ